MTFIPQTVYCWGPKREDKRHWPQSLAAPPEPCVQLLSPSCPSVVLLLLSWCPPAVPSSRAREPFVLLLSSWCVPGVHLPFGSVWPPFALLVSSAGGDAVAVLGQSVCPSLVSLSLSPPPCSGMFSCGYECNSDIFRFYRQHWNSRS